MAEERAQRRLAAILAADVVGYSRLMREDESGTLAQIKTLRKELLDPQIAQYSGRVVKTTGDGILIEFPSAVDAVQCAATVQQAIAQRNASIPADRQIVIRIGINVGDVIVEGDDLYGDGVNVAARLESISDPGGVCISNTVYDQVRDKIDLAFESMGEQQVKNIDRPIPTYRLNLEARSPDIPDSDKTISRRHLPAVAATLAILVIGGVGLGWWQPWAPDVEPASVAKMAYPLPDKPSIAVLHFVNMSDDPKQDYFADGLTEDIITDLSKVSGLLVISRTSTLKYKGKPVAIRQVAEELGVRYVLEGSVRRANDKLRITAQLIDGTSGNHVWAQRYDRNIRDVFAVQDDVARNVVTKMAVRLEEGEQDRLIHQHTTNVEANEFYLRGLATMIPPRRKTLPIARKMFEKAIELDPNFAGGYAGLSWIHGFTVQLGLSKVPRDDVAVVFRLAQKAIALDNTMAKSHTALANAYSLMGEHDQAVQAIEQAVRVEPGYSLAHMLHGRYLVSAGRAAEAIKPIKRAIRMSPRNAGIVLQLGRAYRAAGQFEKAIKTIKEVMTRSGRNAPYTLSELAAAQMQSGQKIEARATVAKLLKAVPNYSVKSVVKRNSFKYREDLDRIVGALRKAGLPEFPPLKLPDKPSIAVLPFTNMSGDKAQEYFSDGITEDIITDLSKVPDILVIARTSVNRYKGKAGDVRKIAKELGVRYIVEGSVRKSDGRVRITAQLIDAINGNHIWAERYDRELKDVFAIQDDVAEQIVLNLNQKLSSDRGKRTSRRYTPKPEAQALAVRGFLTYAPPRPGNLRAAKALFEQAIAIDPKYARPYAGLAEVYGLSLATGLSMSREKDIEKTIHYARKAIEMDDGLAVPHVSLGRLRVNQGRYDEAVEMLAKAVKIEPNYARAQVFYGYYLARAGRLSKALAPTKKALRLAPFTPSVHSFAAVTYFWLGQYEKSVEHFERRESIQSRSNVTREAVRAAAEILAGKAAAARKTVRWILQRKPNIRQRHVFRSHRAKNAEANALLANGLRRAGIPEK